jgi:predicted O-methyltransferase YrrM
MNEKALAASKCINGWMDDSQLEALEELCRGAETIIEVGCYQGKTTKFLALSTDALIIAVDSFENEEYTEFGDYFERFMDNMAEEIQSGRVQCLDCDSAMAAAALSDVRADVVFLDGDHSLTGVYNDIKNYTPLVKPGGILCGHDYLPADLNGEGGIESVRQAVDASFPCVEVRAGIWIKRL